MDKIAKSLKRYNLFLALMHLTAGSLALWAAFDLKKRSAQFSSGLNLDLYKHEISYTVGQPAVATSVKVLGIPDYTVMFMVAAFFLITAFTHFYYLLSPSYTQNVKARVNYFRWLEYALSATIMIIIIALSSGVKDIYTMGLIIFASVSMILTGLGTEASAENGKSRFLYILLGFILLIGIFGVIGFAFVDSIRQARNLGVQLPSWLFGIVIALFVFYLLFGLVPIIFHKRDETTNIRYERAFLTLSILSKLTLGVLVAVGLYQRATMV